MNKEDICYMPAYEMADKIKRQELTSLEITEILIERIEKINPIINAYCTPTFELAREMAKNADESVKKGEKLGLLHGIPISLKDETNIKGFRTTYGSKIFENNLSQKDDVIVKRLKKARAVILGKTNLPDLGWKGVTDNLIFGSTRNPWNLERTSGGSSGGLAASISSGLGALGLGSDGGGSIRIPSSFCGVYGLKPSFGRIPQSFSKLLGYVSTLTARGPIVRYIRDAALLMDAIVGPDDSDRYSIPKPNYSYLEKVDESPKKLKIGFSLDLGFIKTLESEVEDSFLKAIQKFENFNCLVNESKIRIKNPEPAKGLMWTVGYAYALNPYLKNQANNLDSELVKIANEGFKFSVRDIKVAEIQRESVYESVCRHFKNYDILLTPTLLCTAFKLGKDFPEIINGKKANRQTWISFLYPFNFSGHPAATIPCGWSSEGLPIGMQIVGKRFDEVSVLQVSKAFEEIAPWQDKRPQFN
jgi:Asp-tRNA(Asn)/Glu-tRNA(Gln) amidotransferase A subunit family amidase